MSTALGGVPVCFTGAIHDRHSTLSIPAAGTYPIEGEQALALLRTRHGIGDGSDLARISSQQVFLSALARQLQDEATLGNPFTLYSLADVVTRNMVLSDDLADVPTLVSLAKALSTIPLEDMALLTYPYMPAGNRVVPDPTEAEKLFAMIREDEPLVLEAANAGRGIRVEDEPASPTASTTPSPTSGG